MKKAKYLVPLVTGLILAGWLGWCLYLYLLPPHEKLLRDKTVQRGLLYCEQEDEALQLDFYPGTPGAGLVIYIHGGGWRQGNRDMRPNSGVLVIALREAGLNVASIDYRLAPAYQMPDILGDVNCAIDYLYRRGHELGFDSENIGILGASAGGHLGLLVAGLRKATGQRAVQAVAALFAPTNLTRPEQLWLIQPDNFHNTLMRELFGTLDEKRMQRASPLFYAQYLNMPTLLIYGDRDQVVGPGQGMDLYWRLRLFGQPSEFVLVKDSGHLVPLSENTEPDWDELSEKLADFFSGTLKRIE